MCALLCAVVLVAGLPVKPRLQPPYRGPRRLWQTNTASTTDAEEFLVTGSAFLFLGLGPFCGASPATKSISSMVFSLLCRGPSSTHKLAGRVVQAANKRVAARTEQSALARAAAKAARVAGKVQGVARPVTAAAPTKLDARTQDRDFGSWLRHNQVCTDYTARRTAQQPSTPKLAWFLLSSTYVPLPRVH